MKKILLSFLTAILIACASAFCFTACATSGESNGSEPSTPTPTPPPSAETYSITFYDENGSIYTTTSVEKESTPSCNYQKNDDSDYSYEFLGWSDSIGGEILESLPKATENAKYYAIVAKTGKPSSVYISEDSNNYYTIIATATRALKSYYQIYEDSFTQEQKELLDKFYEISLYNLNFCVGNTGGMYEMLRETAIKIYGDFTVAVKEIKEVYTNSLAVKKQLERTLYFIREYIRPIVGYNEENTFYNNAINALSSTNSVSELKSTFLSLVNQLKTDYIDMINQKISDRFNELKKDFSSEIFYIKKSALSAIESETSKNSLELAYNTALENITPINSLEELNTKSDVIYQAFSNLIQEKYLEQIAAWKTSALNKLVTIKNGLVAKISDETLKASVNTFFDNQISSLNQLSTTHIGLAKYSIQSIISDSEEFVVTTLASELTILKNKAISELNTILNANINKLPSETLKTSLRNYVTEQIALINAVNSLDDISTTATQVKTNTQSYIKQLLAQAVSGVKETVKNLSNNLISALSYTPYSLLPASMKPGANTVDASKVNFDASSSFVSVSNIPYGGYGKQWNMVTESIDNANVFVKYLDKGAAAISSVISFINEYYSSAETTEINFNVEKPYFNLSVNYSGSVLIIFVELKTAINIPLIGNVSPSISMKLDTASGTRDVKVYVSETNVTRFLISENSFEAGTTIGLTKGSRTSYITIEKTRENVTGHVYEYYTAVGKDMKYSCADFYVENGYVSVVGTKADGMALLDGYINELYTVADGKLLGYEIMETKTIAKVTAQYNTLWFNLSDISGINSIKIFEVSDDNPHPTSTRSTYHVYLNGSDTIFSPTYNKKLGVKTSRKYDIELRTQYFYTTDESGNVIEHEVFVPMMFIQEGDNFNSYSSDVKKDNGITSSVTLNSTYLDKILNDYDNLIPAFIENKQNIPKEDIVSFINAEIVTTTSSEDKYDNELPDIEWPL